MTHIEERYLRLLIWGGVPDLVDCGGKSTSPGPQSNFRLLAIAGPDFEILLY